MTSPPPVITPNTVWTSPAEDEEEEYDVRAEDHSLLLIIMFGTHFCFFLFCYFWLYPTDEPPKTARMHAIGTDIKKSQKTGEPIRPSTRLYPNEIMQLSRRQQCPERRYQLSSEDQKTLTVVNEGEINYLRSPLDLLNDPTMNYGSLIVKRGVPVVEEVKKENKYLLENIDEEAVVEDLLQLKRMKKDKPSEKNKKKRRKTKERMDALDKMTRPQSAEKNIFEKLMDRGGQSRKVQKTSSTMRNNERTLEVQPTLEEDKTQQRVVKKPSTMRPHQKTQLQQQPSAMKQPSAMDINVKKKKSATLKESKPKEEPSPARTLEEPTRSNNQPTQSSREPSLINPPPPP